MNQFRQSLEQILQTQVQTLSLTLQFSTVRNYRYVAHRFLGYLRGAFPRVQRLSQLRRDPHLLGWFRWLCHQDPPLSNTTREEHLLCLRRLLDDLALQGHPLRPGLILHEDFPVRPQYLPRPLSPEDDQRLQEELRCTDNLYSNALLLMRLTGIRIGECIHLPLDCLRHIGPGQWALHVPLTVQLLRLLDDYGPAELSATLREALDRHTPRLSSVAFILARRHRQRRQRAPLPVNLSRRPDLENLTVSNPSLEAYDELTQDPDEEPEPES